VTDSDNIQSEYQVFVSVRSLVHRPEVYILERQRRNGIGKC
jgi:hypothetical protein